MVNIATHKNKTPQTLDDEKNVSTYSISIGDTESVMSQDPAEYLGVFYNEYENYYEPPVSRMGLARLFLANTHHSSCRTFFANMLCKFFKPSPALDSLEFRNACMDYASFGEVYFQKIYNAAGYVIAYKHQPTLN